MNSSDAAIPEPNRIWMKVGKGIDKSGLKRDRETKNSTVNIMASIPATDADWKRRMGGTTAIKRTNVMISWLSFVSVDLNLVRDSFGWLSFSKSGG